MRTVTVQALQRFVYEGRRYDRGQDVTVAPIAAALLARKGYVSLCQQIPSGSVKRGVYFTTDLVAESYPLQDPAPLPMPPSIEPDPAPTEPRRRRRRKPEGSPE